MAACAYAIRVLLTCIDRRLPPSCGGLKMRYLAKAVLLAAVVLFPALSHAQSLAGTVRDASGGVLPGVTVEAASPVLIEKVRTATTDNTGQYRIENLPPGTYVVTFSLQGFTTVKRPDIAVSRSEEH